MATKQEVDYVLAYLRDVHSTNFFQAINETNVGLGAVLRILSEASDGVTAGEISAIMQVSTARVAVLLKRMSAKGLIVKDSDANDARITIVRLSDTGREKVLQMQRDMYAQVNAVIDQVGIDKMMAFIALWEEIKSVLIPPVVKL